MYNISTVWTHHLVFAGSTIYNTYLRAGCRRSGVTRHCYNWSWIKAMSGGNVMLGIATSSPPPPSNTAEGIPALGTPRIYITAPGLFGVMCVMKRVPEYYVHSIYNVSLPLSASSLCLCIMRIWTNSFVPKYERC